MYHTLLVVLSLALTHLVVANHDQHARLHHARAPGSAEPTSSLTTAWSSGSASASSPTGTGVSSGACSYWLDDIKHQGLAAFNPEPSSYKVYRNVKDYGARGDGVTDDSGAINKAIKSGDRCGPGACNSTTITPAVVYFPPGTYLVRNSIVDYYYTQLIGNPNCLPTIKASANFTFATDPYVIDGDPFDAAGVEKFGPTNVFWRQIRNFIIDTTAFPAAKAITGIHWPTGQATSIQNVIFHMSQKSGTMHQGIFIDQGSGGFMNDLVFNGGKYGGVFGNQQYTMRNLTFNNVGTAISQIWDWGWTYSGVSINNCSVGINMFGGGPTADAVGSVTFIDSEINNTPVGFWTGHTLNATPSASGSLILENVKLSNVPVAVRGGNNKTALAGTPTNSQITAWGEGHSYMPAGPQNFEGPITPVQRAGSLLNTDGSYYARSKPQYEQYGTGSFLSARTLGATGDGHTDDTKALQGAINQAAKQQKILFVDHGDYLVTSTIYIPAGSRIVGETYSVILSSGDFFNDMNKPQPVVQIGKEEEVGAVEWSDMIVSTKGQQRGAVLFEYNLLAPSTQPSGLWDVHSRIGGFAGSDLQLAQCPTTPKTNVTASNLETNCIAAFLDMHVTECASGLYMENVWLWVADHDVENQAEKQITIYAGRGLLIENSRGSVWLVGTAVEHHTKYEYQFVNTRDVYAGQIQTETAYYQPNPSAPLPFPQVASLHDPVFPTAPAHDKNLTIPSADGWGLRIVDSQTIAVYGAGLYSFFNNYSTNCSAKGAGEACQTRIFSNEGTNTAINVYNLNTVGTHYMITVDGKDVARYQDNLDGFVDTIAVYRKS